MKQKPLLTIAIPTYNRSKNLEQILQELRKQDIQSFIILVSDNGSTDNTEKMIRKYQKIMPHLIYNKNTTNLGYSGNVCKLYELASTRYIWFLCDDDHVLPPAVEHIMTAIKKYHPVVALFNTTWIDPFERKLIAGVDKDIVYDDLSSFNNYDALMRTTFLSILVVEKRKSIEAIKETDYTHNIFVQITISLLLLSDKFVFCEVAYPILHRDVGYKYGEFFKSYLIDPLQACLVIPHSFDNTQFTGWFKKHLPSALKLYLSQKMGLFIYNGRPTLKTIKTIFLLYGVNSLFIGLFPVIYFITPSIVLKAYYFLTLVKIHGYRRGKEVYKENINRAFSDKRQSGFATHR